MMGPQSVHNLVADQIASVWDVHSAVTCPDDLLQYLKDIVGFDQPLDFITDRLSLHDLRKLILLAVPLWKELFSPLGIVHAMRLLTGKSVVYYDWFHWRSILGEVYLTEEQQGYDFWVIGSLVTYFDEYHSQVRLMLDAGLDRRLVLDLLELERVSSERVEVALVDFLDQFDDLRDLWETLEGTPATIEPDKTFKMLPGTSEKALMESDAYSDYAVVHLFKLDTATSGRLRTRFYVDDWAAGDYYEVEVGLNSLTLRRYVAGVPTIIANPALGFPILLGLWYKLRVVAVAEGGGIRIKVYIDGNEAVNLNDAGGPTEGEVVVGAAPDNPPPSPDLLVLARYNDFSGQTFDLDFIRDGGSPVISSVATPAISSVAKFGDGSLELDNGGSAEVLDYDGANVVDAITRQGTVEFFYRPNYSGSPTQHQYIVLIGDPGTTNNEILVYNFTTGSLGFIVRGSSSFNVTAAWAPTAGQWYHISVNFDTLTPAAPAIYVDGVLHASIGAASWTRSGVNRIRMGAWYNGAGAPLYRLDSLHIYDTMLRTAPFTPPAAELPAPPYTPGGVIHIDNAEVYRLPLRQGFLEPAGISTSPNYYDP
jgi:hypothetical protein